MSTLHLQNQPRLISELIKITGFGDPFFLVDVGASGGIEPHWSVFGNKLKAVGFDPLVHEIDRLNRKNSNPNIAYEAGFVWCHDYPAPKVDAEHISTKHLESLQRSSAYRAGEIWNTNYVKDIFNSSGEIVCSERKVVLDDFFSESDHSRIDFLKIDTDGHDFPALLGAEKILKRGQVLGISVESQFHGALGDKSNLFTNIDTFLRARGFSLFDLDVWRYSRAHLPRQFYYRLPGQTTHGQVVWGEALYFRDLGHKNYEETWDFNPTESKILKLLCLFELFGLADCGAEVLLKYKDRLSCVENAEWMLNLLTPPLHDAQMTYREYMQAFEADPTAFYPAIEEAAVVSEPGSQERSAPVQPTQKSAKKEIVAQPGFELAPIPDNCHASGRPRSKPSMLSTRGIKRLLRGLWDVSK